MKTVLNSDTFDVVLTNELKRALRSQTFVTLVVIEPLGGGPAATVDQIARLVSAEMRETDLLAADTAKVSLALLDSDHQDSTRAVERVMTRLEHFQFTEPVEIHLGMACCPTHGADLAALKRVAAGRRAGLARHAPRGTAPTP